MNNKIIQSYVYTEDKRYFVSTIERDSSAQDGPQRFNETLVFDWAEGKTGKIIQQEDDCQGCLDGHFNMCLKMLEAN